MTLKWLVMDPTYNNHSSLHVEKDGSVRGWFVLEDGKRSVESRGECGELLMHLKWSYEAEHDERLYPPELGGGEDGSGFTAPPQKRTALEQLTVNSVESQLRIGTPRRAQRYLSALPYLLDVHRITIRDVDFLLKDLFMGLKGQVESSSKPPEAVHIELLEMSHAFRAEAKGGARDPGLTIWEFLFRFFFKQARSQPPHTSPISPAAPPAISAASCTQAFPKIVVAKGPLWQAAFQSSGGMVHGLHSQHMGFWREVWQGVAVPRKPSATASIVEGAMAAAAMAAGDLTPSSSPKSCRAAAPPPAAAPPRSSLVPLLPPSVCAAEGAPAAAAAAEPAAAAAPGPASPRERRPSWYDFASSPAASSLAPSVWPRGRAALRAAPGQQRGRWFAILAALPEQPLWRLVQRLEQRGEHRAAADTAAAWLEGRALASAPDRSSAGAWAEHISDTLCASGNEGARQLAAWYVQRQWRRRRQLLASSDERAPSRLAFSPAL